MTAPSTVRNILSIFGFLILIFFTPLAGAWMAGLPIAPFLEFPPITEQVEQPSFSLAAFILILGFILVTTWPFWKRMIFFDHSDLQVEKTSYGSDQKFPWWGWLAAGGMILFWVLAWTRFPWFEPLQRHTFFPLWFCFIITLNAIAVEVSGKSLMTRKPLYFSLLFPVSAAFWWVFEYLNRFAGNWYYVGAGEITGWQYFLEATLAFSTVLPAVLSIRVLLYRFPVFASGFRDFPAMSWLSSSRIWTLFGIAALMGLFGIGFAPEWTFPLLWIAPGLLWVTFQQWKHALSPIIQKASTGDLTWIWNSVIAALICGFFWEMWNIGSQAKWIYSIPGVERFYLFEMPILGYAGYLPFGVICALVAHSLFQTLENSEKLEEEAL